MGSVLGTGRQHATSVRARFVGVQSRLHLDERILLTSCPCQDEACRLLARLGVGGGLLGQLATVGGEFISEQQRLNQPVHEELGKIGGTISRSGFVQGATNGVAEVPNLIGTKTSLVSSTVAMKINLLQTLACIFVPQQCPTTTTTKSSTP